jgi:hypothetical protein
VKKGNWYDSFNKNKKDKKEKENERTRRRIIDITKSEI